MTGAAFCGAVLASAPAGADVTVTPDRAVRGDAAKLTFRVTDERGAAYTTKIELLLPEAAPIAEVWPLTVPDWAPLVTTRKLDSPLTGVHHGQVTEVTSRITWTRAAAAKPADAAELQVSMGPMPEADRLLFTVVQTYSDGTVVRWNEQPTAGGGPVSNQAPVLTLDAPAANGGAHGGAHGGTGTVGGDAGAPQPPQAAGSEDGNGLGSLATGLLIGLLVGGGAVVWLARGRRGQAPGAAPGEVEGSGEDAEPVAVRPAWRLRE